MCGSSSRSHGTRMADRATNLRKEFAVVADGPTNPAWFSSGQGLPRGFGLHTHRGQAMVRRIAG